MGQYGRPPLAFSWASCSFYIVLYCVYIIYTLFKHMTFSVISITHNGSLK